MIFISMLAALPMMAQDEQNRPELPPAGASAQQTDRVQVGDRAVHRQRLIQKFDVNKDGKLDDQEKAAMQQFIDEHNAKRGDHRREMNRGDKQGRPGAEGRGEGRESREGRGEGPRRPNREEIIKRFDKDGDGKLSAEERAEMRKQLGRSGGEGRGEGREGRGEGPRRQNRDELIKRFDKDQDGKLDDEERAEMEKELQKQRPRRAGRHGKQSKPQE